MSKKWLKTDKEVPDKMSSEKYRALRDGNDSKYASMVGENGKRNKYGNTGKGTSKLEKKHQAEYENLERAGAIKEYHPQHTFVLQDKFRRDGKAIRAIKYVADHYIIHLDGSEEVVDSKGFETPVFKIKQKMFLKRYPEIKFTVRK